MTAVIRAEKVSKWYGNVLGLSEVTLEIGPGVTGLLGPNGAGKSTFMKLLTGQLKPSLGRVEILGRPVWNDPALFARIGFCPEPDAFFDDLTGGEFVTRLLALHGFGRREAEERAGRALALVELDGVAGRLLRGYSRGMRQRLKIAQTIAHDPEVLILDEPLGGLDPLSKRKVIRLIREYRDAGRTVLVSSHVLPEIEALTRSIVLLHQGKILAQGDIAQIRDLIDKHPHKVAIACADPRALAAALVGTPDVGGLQIEADGKTVVFETRDRDAFYGRLQALVHATGLDIEEITSPDDNLQAVFDYLVGR